MSVLRQAGVQELTLRLRQTPQFNWRQFMAKTLAQIDRQIRELQRQAVALKAKEAPGVIQRIKEAIEHYGFSAEQLFGGKSEKAASAKSAKKAKAKPESGSVKGTSKKVASKSAGVVRYRDDAGNTWTGRGPRPKWMKEAIAGGKALDDLKVA
jgi:DNA-binding protein H-NS